MTIPRRFLVAGFFLAVGPAAAAPVVTVTSPAPGASVSSLTSISVTFSEPVTGVDALDLEVAGGTASGVTGSGAGPYVFMFSQPAAGTVAAGWDVDHGIAGVGTGAFAPTGSWAYTLADTLAPEIAKIRTSVAGQEMDAVLPVPGATVAALTETRVTFSEPVTGVDAADLLVNGTPAAAVTGAGEGPYVFAFPQPAEGAVTFSWNAAAGIADGNANQFAAGGSWQVTRAAALGTVEITEFLAANGGVFPNPANGVRDEDFDLSPWIELTNTGAAEVNLLGWSLTDDPAAPAQWILPARVLASGARLVVWASGKDRKPPAGDAVKHLHTNFSLNPGGGALALHAPDAPAAAAVSEYAAYPEQRYDHSYGAQAGDGEARYFSPPSVTQSGYTLPSTSNPTPAKPAVPNGAANPASALTAVTPPPDFSVRRGYFNEPFSVVLSCPEAAAVIRYTLNGAVPTAASPAYAGPITVSGTTVLRAAAFGSGMVPSTAVTHSYLFLDGVTAQPSPPYDNPANANDNTNPPAPSVGGVALPVAWGTNSTGGFPGAITNLTANQVPADYGMDPKVYADPAKYDDSGAVNAETGRTNADRIRTALRTLPMLSLVLKTDDMFGPGGLYPTSSDSDKTDRTKPCSLELLLPDGGTGFTVDCGIDIHGNASRAPFKNPKHGFTLRFKGKYGAGKLVGALYPDSPVREWDKLVLRGDFNSSWLHQSGDMNLDGGSQRTRGIRIRDAWCKETFRDMGRMAGHHRYTNLFINGVYWGTYDLAEDQADDFGSSYFGGSKADYDVIDQGVLKSGDWTAYRAMKALLGWQGAPTYNTAPTLPGAVFTNAQLEQLKQYLDVPWFIDYMLHHFYTGHQDWATTTDYNKNWYLIRRRDGTFKYLPWDQENLLWSPTDNRVTGAQYPPTAIHPRLNTNAEYKLLFADRAHRHCVAPDGALRPEACLDRLERWTDIMNADAMCLESARWGDYRYKVHRYASGVFTEVYTWNGKWNENGVSRNNTANQNNWVSEIKRLKSSYFPVRANNLIGHLRGAGLYPTQNAPVFRNAADDTPVASGRLTPGFALKMDLPTPAPGGTTSTGTIYYTIDGNDPRLPYDTTGQPSPTALVYSAPVSLTGAVTVKARSLNGVKWSALMEASFTAGAPLPAVRITEVHYNPAAALGGSAAEFVELQNTGATAADLSTWTFDGIEFIFPVGFTLAPGARAVLVSNDSPAVFAAQYPGVTPAGFFGASLANAGERLTLRDRAGSVVASVAYEDQAPWPAAADGGGPSLENVDPNGDPDSPVSWRASAVMKGTPGAANSAAAVSPVILSEFLTTTLTAGPETGWVEFQNTGDAPADLSGCRLWKDGSVQLVLPANTTLAPGAFLTIPMVLAPVAGPHLVGRLGEETGELYLTSAANTMLDGVRYGRQMAGLAFGKINGAWVPTNPTRGAANAAAATAPATDLRLNEWRRFADGSGGLEIRNLNATLPLPLTGAYFEVDRRMVRYAPPALLPPGGHVWLDLREDSRATGLLNVSLSVNGGAMRAFDANGAQLDSVTYRAPDAEVSEGRLPDGTGAATLLPFPSPGAANYAPVTGAPVFNEILAVNRTGENTPWATRAGWVELRNPEAVPVSLAGWKLKVAPALFSTWTFPAGVTLAPGGVLAVWCDPASPASVEAAPALNTGLILGGGEWSSLELINPNGQTARQLTWGWQVPDHSLTVAGNGSWNLTRLPTRGMPNVTDESLLGLTGAVRINEWSADAAGVLTSDFVELYNPSPLPVAVGGLWLSDDPSEAGRAKWRIPERTFLPAGGFIHYHAAVPGGRGNLNFGLSAGGDSLWLGGASTVDSVSFGAASPGTSEGRLTNGAATVLTLAPTPGLPNAAGPAPVFAVQPVDVAVPLGGNVDLSAYAPHATLQWMRNGVPIEGRTAEHFALPNVTAADDALYTCVATYSGISISSRPARVSVLMTYAAWSAANGAGPGTADPDGDGVNNFAEFLAGTSPFAAGAAQVSPVFSVESPGAFLAVDMPLNSRASFGELAGDLSEDLLLWNTTPPAFRQVLSTDASGNQIVRFHFAPTEGARRLFLRMSLTP